MFISDRKYNSLKLKNFEGLIMISMSFFVIFFLTLFSRLELSNNYVILLVIINIIILSYVIYNVFILERIDQREKLKQELNMLQLQQDLNQKRYQEKLEQYYKQQKIIHDVKKHLNAIESLYESGEFTKGREYANQLNQQITYSNNNIQNSVLYQLFKDFEVKCKSTNIELKYQFKVPLTLNGINDFDVITIFSNMFDNALEATVLCENPIIEMRSYHSNNMITFEIKNKYKTKVLKKENSILSSKKNHKGLGIKNIQETIEKNHGFVDFSYDDQWFKIMILLPEEV